MVLPLPLARLRPLGQPPVLDASDALAGAGARAPGPARSRDARRGRGHRLHHRGHRRARRAGAGDDARPEPAPARAGAAQARAARLPQGAGGRRGPAVRRGLLRPLRVGRVGRVLAGAPARRGRGLPGAASRRHGAADRPAAASRACRARARGRVDAVPGGRGVPGVVRARRVRAVGGGHARRAVAQRRRGALRDRDARRQAGRRPVAASVGAQARGPVGSAGADRAAALRRALRARLAGRGGVRAGRASCSGCARGRRAGAADAALGRTRCPPARRAGEPARGAVALRAPAHGHRDADEHHRPLSDRGRAGRGAGRGRSRVDARGRLRRQRLHRRAQPDHRRRDRPDQQAVPPDRGRRPDDDAGVVDRRRLRARAGRAGADPGDRRAGGRARGAGASAWSTRCRRCG